MPSEHSAPDPTDVLSYAAPGPSGAGSYRDLCSTCNHAEACRGRSTPERPIFFCELFESFVPASAAPAAPAAPRPAAPSKDAKEHKGLCMNCENRQTCSLPRPAGGVWHCEEYR